MTWRDQLNDLLALARKHPSPVVERLEEVWRLDEVGFDHDVSPLRIDQLLAALKNSLIERNIYAEALMKETSPGSLPEEPKPFTRDPDADCVEYTVGDVVARAVCETDGHYLCKQCRHNKHRLEEPKP